MVLSRASQPHFRLVAWFVSMAILLGLCLPTSTAAGQEVVVDDDNTPAASPSEAAGAAEVAEPSVDPTVEQLSAAAAEEDASDEEVSEDVPTRDAEAFRFTRLPGFPSRLQGAYVGAAGDTLIVAGGERVSDAGATEPNLDILVLRGGATDWEKVGELPSPMAWGASASSGNLLLIGGEREGEPVADVMRVSLEGAGATVQSLPALPEPISRAAAVTLGGRIYLAGGRGTDDVPSKRFLVLDPAADAPAWTSPSDNGQANLWPGEPLTTPVLVALQENLYLFGGRTTAGEEAHGVYTWHPRTGWQQLTTPPRWPANAAAAGFGHAHIFVFGGTNDDGTTNADILAYHTITDRWLTLGRIDAEAGPVPANPTAITLAKLGPARERIALVSATGGLVVEPVPTPPNYTIIDHSVVALYLLAMVGMGWYFAGREKNTSDYFRGGRRVPWWATGMSLFATGASAISLLSMPGKSYATDWTYFSISIFSLVALPVSMFLLAPLVRRLNIATANEYLERRFGVVARMVASVIYIFTQVAGRMAPVMLLPSIALSAITGIDVWLSILIMGVVVTAYTFLGGLEAVIWTDTVQGLIMCAAVAGCLALALLKLGGDVELTDTALAPAGKAYMFDWSPSIFHATAMVFFLSTVVSTLGGVGDQNFVQRVQATPTLRQAKAAIATQLAVAVPINVLLFGLGTALWLFYRSRPEQLDPTIQTDSVYPFFVAQQLPQGVSGLVVAALLAATMSTISSSICAVSDIGVNDFYRRFVRSASDRSAFILGRVLVAVIGAFGTAVAVFLSFFESPSIWDLALLVTGLVSNGILGLFWLGLLTRRANEIGALIGVAAGMATVIGLERLTSVHFLLYTTIGSLTVIIVGYLASLVIPMRPREVVGLTLFTLDRSNEQTGLSHAPAHTSTGRSDA